MLTVKKVGHFQIIKNFAQTLSEKINVQGVTKVQVDFSVAV